MPDYQLARVTDIREIKELKRKLEQDVAATLLQFTVDTGAEIKQVTLIKRPSLDKPFTYDVKLEVII